MERYKRLYLSKMNEDEDDVDKKRGDKFERFFVKLGDRFSKDFKNRKKEDHDE